MEIRETSILSEDAQSLIARLDLELSGEYAPEHTYTVDFEPFHRDGGVFVVAYDEATAVACGALRSITDCEVELKRMYVAGSHRGQGVSRRILGFLEERARELGFSRMLLETGDEQHAAISLYQSSGYLRIDAFGEYAGSPRSVCFAKDLQA